MKDGRILIRSAVCVIGLGRIGLPIALVTANRGAMTYGVDIDSQLVKELLAGRFRGHEPGLMELYRSCGAKFQPTTNLREGTRHARVVLCCVGTRRFATNKPNLKVLWNIFDELATLDIKGKLIVLKTTVPIGTTRDLAKYLERRTGLQADTDFFMAFSPERTVEGKAVRELQTLPVIVGAVGERSLRRTIRFYKEMGSNVVSVMKSEAAELAKLIDNTFRITRFAFANDISFVAERLGLNVYDIIDAVNYRYPRNSIPYPSCGVSGYCLTKDPYYLEDAFKRIREERGFPSIWMTARRSYDYRSEKLVGQVEDYLISTGLRPEQMKILVCGIAYKANIDDIRDSHGVFIAKECLRRRMGVSTWDPCVGTEVPGIPSCEDASAAFRAKDAAIFTVAHKQFLEMSQNLEEFTRLMRTPLVYDGAAVFRNVRFRKTRMFHLIGTGLQEDSLQI